MVYVIYIIVEYRYMMFKRNHDREVDIIASFQHLSYKKHI